MPGQRQRRIGIIVGQRRLRTGDKGHILRFRFARGGRMDPTDLSLDIDRKPPLLPAADVLRGAYEADDIARFLRDQHPQHDQFRKLRESYLKIRDEERDQAEQAAADAIEADGYASYTTAAATACSTRISP